jgi:hypothetical protein
VIQIVSIVEGRGEIEAVPILLRRLLLLAPPGQPWDVQPAIRIPRGRLLKVGELERAVDLAGRRVGGKGLVLVVLDSDDDCPAELGPRLSQRAASGRFANVLVVLAKREFEAWLVAAAESIAGKRGLPEDLSAPQDPEAIRGAKEWLSDRMGASGRYSPTLDQPALTAEFSIEAARARSPSFERCCRRIETFLRGRSPE